MSEMQCISLKMHKVFRLMKTHLVHGQSNNKAAPAFFWGGIQSAHCCLVPRPRVSSSPSRRVTCATVTCFVSVEKAAPKNSSNIFDMSEMMDVEQNNDESEDSQSQEFYTDAAKYWDKVPATVDGMLGGFGHISQIDIEGSNIFLRTLFKMTNPPQKTYALDCGSGIGRITKNLLTKHFKRVDLVEQSSKFLETAKTSLLSCSSRIGEFYPLGLQDFSPDAKKYDVIWSQWVLGHLKDDDLIDFFKKCIPALRDNGVIVVKENVTSSDKLEIDTQDSSVTRPLADLQECFRKAGLVILKERVQHKMPQGLYPVYMFALRPVTKSSPSNSD